MLCSYIVVIDFAGDRESLDRMRSQNTRLSPATIKLMSRRPFVMRLYFDMSRKPHRSDRTGGMYPKHSLLHGAVGMRLVDPAVRVEGGIVSAPGAAVATAEFMRWTFDAEELMTHVEKGVVTFVEGRRRDVPEGGAIDVFDLSGLREMPVSRVPRMRHGVVSGRDGYETRVPLVDASCMPECERASHHPPRR